jgi:hypothetical protein
MLWSARELRNLSAFSMSNWRRRWAELREEAVTFVTLVAFVDIAGIRDSCGNASIVVSDQKDNEKQQ